MAEYFNLLLQQLMVLPEEIVISPSSPRLLMNDSNGDETPDDSDPETTTSNTGGGGGRMGNDRFEFIAFLLWYIFLVFCCVVPTCCAYRRRRRAELRLAAQQANLNRLQHSNLFILSNLQRHSANTERIQQERKRILTEELKATTMTLTENDLEEASPSVIDEMAALPEPSSDLENQKSDLGGDGAESKPRPAATSTTDDIPVDAAEYSAELNDLGEESGIVRLPADRQNADRTVSGTCSICLCPYADGDSISWSTGNSTCLHAFHTDCVISWLAKKEEPKCPICRQTFCATANVSEILDPSSAHHNTESSFLESFSQAFALSQFYRQQEAAYASSANTPEDLEAARRANQLELRNLALRHHILRTSVLRDAEERAAARQRALNGEVEMETTATPRSYDIPFTFRYIGRESPSVEASADTSRHQSSSVGTDDAAPDSLNHVTFVEREGDVAVDDDGDAPQESSASRQQH